MQRLQRGAGNRAVAAAFAVQRDHHFTADAPRTPDQVDELARQALAAIARNESGGRRQARPSSMGTASGVPASYASATQMTASHATSVLKANPSAAREHGITREQLDRAEHIMHATQRIWDRLVTEAGNIHDVAERDVETSGLTLDDLTRMMRFGQVRLALRAARPEFERVRDAVASHLRRQLEARAAWLTGLVSDTAAAPGQAPGDAPQANEGTPPAAGTPDAEAEADALAEEALSAGAHDRQVGSVAEASSRDLPGRWDRMSPAQRRSWVTRARSRLRRMESRIGPMPEGAGPRQAKVADRAAAWLITSRLMSNEHVGALGLGRHDVNAYFAYGRVNRFPEDRNAWNRVALQRAAQNPEVEGSQSLDAAIGSAAEADGGWALSNAEFTVFVRRWVARHPAASDEQVIRAAAAHNGRSSTYPDTIVGHWRALRREAAASSSSEGPAGPEASSH